MRESLAGTTCHEEAFQDPILNNGNPSRLDSLVVEPVSTHQVSVCKPAQGGVEINRSDVGQDLLVQHLLEGLGFLFVLLPVTLEAVSKDFVKENAAGATAEDRRA